MNRFSMSRAAAVIAVLAVPAFALPTSVLAQSAPAAEAPGPAPVQSVEAHIQALHQQLQITPAEEPQWQAFAQVMRNNAAQMEQAFQTRGANLETMNAVQDLQSYAQVAQVQSVNMQKLAVSFEALYNSFPAGQQKIADGVFRAKIASHPKAGMKPPGP